MITKSAQKSVDKGYERPSHPCGSRPAARALHRRRVPLCRHRDGLPVLVCGANRLHVVDAGEWAARRRNEMRKSPTRPAAAVRAEEEGARRSFTACACCCWPFKGAAPAARSAAEAVKGGLQEGVISHSFLEGLSSGKKLTILMWRSRW